MSERRDQKEGREEEDKNDGITYKIKIVYVLTTTKKLGKSYLQFTTCNTKPIKIAPHFICCPVTYNLQQAL